MVNIIFSKTDFFSKIFQSAGNSHKVLPRTFKNNHKEIVPVVYPRGTVGISSLGSFSSVGSSSKPYHPYFPLYFGARHIQYYFKKNRGRKRKSIKPQ